MSNNSSNNETVECNCWQYLHDNAINFVNGEVNNNNISIDTTERTNDNTIVIVFSANFDSKATKSYCEKAAQTIPELETSQDILIDKTTNMDKDRNDCNNFPLRSNVNNISNFKSVQTNQDEIITMEEFQTLCTDMNIRSNNEGNIAKGSSKNVSETQCTRPQNLSVSEARFVDESIPVNNQIVDNSQITRLLDQSDRNKAVINSVMTKFMSNFTKHSQSKFINTFAEITASNKSALKQIMDVMRKESPNVETAREKNAHAFTQTENVRNDHKSTQTDPEFAIAYYNNWIINMEPNCLAMKDFLRDSKICFEEFQNKLQVLFLQGLIQSKDQKDKLRNNIQQTFYDEGANTSSSGNNDQTDNTVVNSRDNAGINSNVSNRGIAGDSGSVGNNSRHVSTIGNRHATNIESNHNGADTNNNDKAFNTVNPMPRQEPVVQEEQPLVMQSPGQFSGNHSTQVRAGRARSENPRFSPYPRQQFWQQSEFNVRHRQPQHVHECPNVNGMHVQHNSMIRPYNGWQTPNPPNPQSFFTPHHHHHHHF